MLQILYFDVHINIICTKIIEKIQKKALYGLIYQPLRQIMHGLFGIKRNISEKSVIMCGIQYLSKNFTYCVIKYKKLKILSNK